MLFPGKPFDSSRQLGLLLLGLGLLLAERRARKRGRFVAFGDFRWLVYACYVGFGDPTYH